ncbi:MAG TPA: hypothetical protein VHX87_04125 [Galbitalea sp.]|jgi:hypothetical protein|nr:hypothetical protein [Galbitalea sp.]
MALLHHAELVPSKLELLAGWAPSQSWFGGDAKAPFATVSSYRFDDPDGQVGIETLLIRAGDGPILQIPLTYRNEELPGAEKWFVGNMEHSVLGKRWAYDAVGDPVYLGRLAAATLGGGQQADQYFEEEGKRVTRNPTAVVKGSGPAGFVAPSASDDHVPATRNDAVSTLVETDRLAFFIARIPVLNPLKKDDDSDYLSGTWTDQPDPCILALVSLRN